jgi:SPP1 family predicted phage head-tail adaptor
MMRAGSMRHQIQLQTRSTTQDAVGEPANTWTDFAVVRASIDRTPGREVFSSAERNARVPTVFRIRYIAGVLPSMRILFGGKVYNITSAIDQTGIKEELMISAEELVEATP